MAKKAAKEAATKHTCRECEYSHSWYGSNWQGEVFMCKCQHSQWSKLLNGKQCNQFKMKRNG